MNSLKCLITQWTPYKVSHRNGNFNWLDSMNRNLSGEVKYTGSYKKHENWKTTWDAFKKERKILELKQACEN